MRVGPETDPRAPHVKITRAEAGGLEGRGLWRPAQLGLRPRYENADMQAYLAGAFLAGSDPKKEK